LSICKCEGAAVVEANCSQSDLAKAEMLGALNASAGARAVAGEGDVVVADTKDLPFKAEPK
jgi:hypothetical protein